MGRAPCCDKANVKKGPWAPEEDATLKEYIEQYGTGGNWIALPQKIGLKRCGKSCRLRWLNYLRPNIKHGGFSEEEDNIICNLYISIGSRWSIIAAQLPGRTDNDIKNYWNTRLKKKLLGRRKDSQGHRLSHLSQGTKDVDCAEDNSYPNTLSNSALERLQLHMQLQNIQNPFSFYNNPALWPKMHPYGEKLMQDQYGLVPSPPTRSFQEEGLNELPIASIGLEPANTRTTNLKQVETPLNGFSSSESSIGFKIGQSSLDETSMPKPNSVQQFNINVHSISNLQAELGELLHSKEACFGGNGSQLGELDCFTEMDGGKDGMIWWETNDFDTKSSSSNSWDDSASVLQPQGLFQDYVLSYDL